MVNVPLNVIDVTIMLTTVLCVNGQELLLLNQIAHVNMDIMKTKT